jgi:23S rRNA pseudouridine1911/1915/1917 synthase
MRLTLREPSVLNAPRGAVIAIQADQDAQRLDVVLAKRLTSRSVAQRLIEAGAVKVNGEVAVRVSQRVKQGDLVIYQMPHPEQEALRGQAIDLNVLYEDEDVVVINKPKGMVVHPAPGASSGTLVHALLYRYGATLSSLGGKDRPGIAHRIDKDTSGVILVARNDFAHRHLAAQIKAHEAHRVYIALVHGRPPQKGRIEGPIGRHPGRRLEMAVVEGGKPAVTHFSVIEELGEYSLLRVRLETGRTHQIRVHMAFAGYPVVGDPVYGHRQTRLFNNGQALHAWFLTFKHPRLETSMTCVAPLPPDFTAILAQLRSATAARS